MHFKFHCKHYFNEFNILQNTDFLAAMKNDRILDKIMLRIPFKNIVTKLERIMKKEPAAFNKIFKINKYINNSVISFKLYKTELLVKNFLVCRN